VAASPAPTPSPTIEVRRASLVEVRRAKLVRRKPH
jgi:hypothetical protein